MMDSATAAPVVIEIVEKRRKPKNDSPFNALIAPNDIRLNGQSLLCSADDPVILHEVSTRSDELVRVTLTVFAKRVFIGHEDTDEDPDLSAVAAAQQEVARANREAADATQAANDRIRAAMDALAQAQRDASEVLA